MRTSVTLYRPGMVKAWWASYCPGLLAVPAISCSVDVMIKSALFIASRSAVNWQLKWYLGSSSFLR